ncbi:helix-turn-helix domain-containing protein [Ereboglobus luteus]|uniref:helix-turn-helix domain-containing protein n=1 Tax=Ereboglobus luteus TaxID=1796921 RepID=UPI001F1FD3AF|nr:helix-turn-helix domain-containing protein [Ereboglobus luteus]
MQTTTPHTTPRTITSPMTDITGLRLSGIFPAGREPSIRTLREWTKRRRIPYHKVGHFVYYDLNEVMMHIRTRLKVPARA